MKQRISDLKKKINNKWQAIVSEQNLHTSSVTTSEIKDIRKCGIQRVCGILLIIYHLTFTDLVYLEIYIKISYTGLLINSRYLFLTVVEAGKPKIKVPQHLVRMPFQVHRLLSSSESFHGKKRHGTSLGPLLYRL